MKDDIYAQPKSQINNFVFDKNVVDVFEDMINRSVPGYGAIISMIAQLAEKYVKANTHCYDLGCSLGASTRAMNKGINIDGVKIISVDNAQAMIDQCRSRVDGQNIELICDDILNIDIVNASMVVLNFTLQFVDPDERLKLIKRIYDGLNKGGILVLSEKIAFDDPAQQEFQTQMHHAFKRLQGYSDLEISQKRTALEKVLLPETCDEHRKRLQFVGFQEINVWFQCFNFISLVAIK